ncbi:hypothetical protein WOC12_03930 [Vibrio parahaemolyticus]|uniref:hypothetical protein n=1 Tax=Vibrio parahaemolyticus TaxID=670 RepID=UPI00081BF08C|nr:hypothetical protein [Vibrio parahaemolyticus]EIO4084154.1 hypothetical protein [Vibrio parahaemolyticus]EJC1449124.1 hypothetical protein [Vibrio parahaemolyticus]EJE4209409.1 hypothetical protein [Vibrio parahaemolyticus]ELA9721832.1 hypothetical protein [Vibrio parahaemolyticus]MDF4610610.1 hypothetical protein [Vibrio parahaemolyticus]
MSENFLLSNASEAFVLSVTPDWPSLIVTGMIGLGSILTSVAVAYITYSNQKTQNRAKQAELRQEWLKEARDTISSITSLCHVIKVRCKVDKTFIRGQDYFDLFQELLSYRSKITLMLDSEKESTKNLLSILADLVDSVAKRNVDKEEMKAYMYAFEELANDILEKAWSDIKRDLGNKI